MNILFTGVEKNLVETLKCIRVKKKRDSSVHIKEIFDSNHPETHREEV